MQLTLNNDYLLRPFLYGDYLSLAKHANNPEISNNLKDSFPYPYTIDHARSWIAHVKKHESRTRFCVDYHGECIGDIGFVAQLDIYRFTAEIGYWISQDHWGKGIMTQAVKKVSNYAFNNFELIRLYADIQDHNIASMKILERCGFKKEAILRKHIYKNHKFIDQYIYGVLKDELKN